MAARKLAMYVGIPRESAAGERRVAMVPTIGARLIASGFDLGIEPGAGLNSGQSDDAYETAGVTIASSAAELFGAAGIVAKVQALSVAEANQLQEGAIVVSFFQPATNLELVNVLMKRRISAFSLDFLPRISRAQSMDALSSQSTVTGYAGTLVAANRLPKFFPMFMSAAGTIPPAKVLIMGAGVAGLQAIATARRLGAVVRAYDVRAAAKEEVQSLGATFVALDLEAQEGSGGYAATQSEDFLARQRELIAVEVAASDVVITTAAIPGRKAPVLVTADMVHQMSRGSVVVDLAAESGGNCELSAPGQEIDVNGVLVYGAKDLASSMAMHASLLYARNIAEFIGLIAPDRKATIDLDDEIIAGTCVTHEGAIHHGPTREVFEATGK